jgi:hypothetical protein
MYVIDYQSWKMDGSEVQCHVSSCMRIYVCMHTYLIIHIYIYIYTYIYIYNTYYIQVLLAHHMVMYATPVCENVTVTHI